MNSETPGRFIRRKRANRREAPPDREILGAILGLGRHTRNYLPAYIIPAVLSVVGVSVFTRIFSPGEYGQYALVMAAIGIMITLLSGWLSQSILRFLPEYKASGQLADFISSAAVIIIVTVILFCGFSLLIYPFLARVMGAYTRFYLLAILLVGSGSIFANCNSMFQATLQSSTFAKNTVLFAIGQISFSLAFVFLIAKDVIGLIVGSIMSYASVLLLTAKELSSFSQRNHSNVVLNVSLFKRFLFYGFPMLGWIMGSQILNISDRFIIQAFKGASQVGIYSSNYSLASKGIGLVSAAFLMAAHPLIMNAWEGGYKKKVTEIISSFSRYFLLIALPITFYFGVFGRDVVSILLGKEFQSGYVVVPIVLFGLLAWNFSMYGHKGLEIMKKTPIMFLLVGICAVVNIGLNFAFVPIYGYIAAAVSTSVSCVLYPFMVYFATKSYIEWQIPWESVAKIAVSSFMTAGFLAILKFWVFHGSLNIGLLVILSLCGVIIYPALLYVFRELQDYEICYFRRAIAKLRSRCSRGGE